MGKTTKRARKFTAKGGISGMLKKGTVTKKGKIKMRKKDGAGAHSTEEQMEIRREMNQLKAHQAKQEHEEKRKKDDFLGNENIGDLDLESFLENVTEHDDDDDDDDKEQEEMNMDDYNEDEDDDMQDDSDDGDSDDSSVMDDEDIEAAEIRMKEEMKKLAESDPDFHQYLQDNDASLLDFQSTQADADDVDGEDDDGEEMEQPEEQKSTVVDAKLLKSYENGAFKNHGIKSLRKLISIYTSACHMADSSKENEDGVVDQRNQAYHIESSAVFDKLMITCLTKCHEAFHYHLLGKGAAIQPGQDSDDDGDENQDEEMDEENKVDKPINPRHLTRSSHWGQLKLSIQSFFKATLHLISEAKESKLLSFIVKSLSHYIPYLSSFPRLAKAILKTMTTLWSTTSELSTSYQSVRLNAFLRIRQIALTQPFPFIENCLKATYLAYAKSAKFANAATVTSLLPTLTFMGNCVVELYSLDYASSYQHAFVYIRQLALHLRTALQKKTPESFRIVYCWQYMHCLKLWTAILAAACGKPSEANVDDETTLMRSLIYPLVEVIFGVARLIPTTRHLPLRLHCVRYLQQLAAASELFIPTTSILLDVFDLKEVSMAPKRVKNRGNDVRGVRLPLILKLPRVDPLRTSEQLDACFGEVFLLLNREIDLYRHSAGFPEFTIRICQRLRKVRIASEKNLVKISLYFF